MPYRQCTCSEGCGYKPPPPEDVSSWCQSVVEYVKDTQVNCLDLQTVPGDGVNWNHIDVQPIFDSLVGSEITELNLAYKNLANKIPKFCEILMKTKITKLNLKYCRLTVDDLMSLMAVLKDTQITELDISNNQTQLEKSQLIKKFIAHLVSSRLRSLNLSFNRILPLDKASAFFQRLHDTKLKSLDLSSFFMRGGSMAHFKHSECLYTLVSSLPHTVITDLNLESNALDDDFAKALGPVLGKSKLEWLNLRYNKLTDAGIDFLVPGLVNSKITYLNLFNNGIHGDNSLGRFLKDTKIRELDLSSNPISSKKMFSGTDFLQGSAVNTLKFCWSFYSNKTIPLHIKRLKFSNLICLDLSGNKLTFEHFSALADVLSSSNLTHLMLRGNKFCEESFKVLGDSFIKSKLKYINLSATGWSVGTKETKVARFNVRSNGFASLIEKSKGSTIRSVNLNSIDLGDDGPGLDVIVPVLANTSLLELDLSRNKLKDDITSLAEQLKFTSLTALHLYLNNIGFKGVTVLSKYLEGSQIVILTLRSNSIGNKGAIALAEVLKRTKLRHLDLKSNMIEDKGLESLAESARNSCITYLNVDNFQSNRKLLIDGILWENRRRIQKFAELLKRTALFTGDSNIFEFDRSFEGIDINIFIEDCLKLYKTVAEEPFIVSSIEQDKCISDLINLKRFDYDTYSSDDVRVFMEVFIEDSSRIYQKIMGSSTPIQNTSKESVLLFNKKILWLMLEEFPQKFVAFIGRIMAPDVEQHVFLLRRVEDLGLSGIVELLLLNRSAYVIDQNQEILHSFVYKLLLKYNKTVCSTEAKPDGVEKIIEYFREHLDLNGASEVISLLGDSKST